jgi:hypothetical protein
VRKTKLTCGVHMSARGEREGDADGRRGLKKKAYFAEYAKAGAWAARLVGRGPGGLGRPAGQGLVGEGQAGWAESEERNKIISELKLDFQIYQGMENL